MQASDMKQIIFSALAIVGMFSFISCERHEWEDTEDGKGTKRLYPKQEHGAHDSHGGHEEKRHAEHGKDEHAGHDHDKGEKHDHAKDSDSEDHKH